MIKNSRNGVVKVMGGVIECSEEEITALIDGEESELVKAVTELLERMDREESEDAQ